LTNLNDRIRELETDKGKSPATTIQRACSTIEIVVKELLTFSNGTSLAALQEEFRARYPTETHLHHKITTLRKVRNAIVHEDRQPWPGDEDIAIGTLKNFAHLVHRDQVDSLSLNKLSTEISFRRGPSSPILAFCSATPFSESHGGAFDEVAEAVERAPRLAWKDFENLVEGYFEDTLGIQFEDQVSQDEADGGRHKFDIVSIDREIVIECKSHTWTKGGNYPSAKVADALVAAEHLKGHSAKRKLLVFQDDTLRGKSLAETFMRRNREKLHGIEIWVYADGIFRHL
jgi:hypothetical protein